MIPTSLHYIRVCAAVGVVLALQVCLVSNVANADEYEIGFSTFLGGSGWEHGRDIFVDESGNVFVVGGTVSDDFPTTEGAFQRHHDKTGKRVGSGGHCDVFVSKFDSAGRLVWSTLIGGPNYDRAYAVEVDKSGFVYVSGRCGPGFPTTEGSFQTDFQGTDNGIYGMQNGFVAKLRPNGSALEWAAYVGVGQLCRDFSIDDHGDIYVPLHYTGKGPLPPKEWFSGAYQPNPAGGVEIGAIKIASDGRRVHWATWLGGSGNEVPNCGLRIDQHQNVYLNFTTQSGDVPTTAGAHDRTYNGDHDAFVAKLGPDGKNLIFGTYFGGSGNEGGNSTHNLALDSRGHAFLSTSSNSADLPVTEGAVQAKLAGGKHDIAIAKFAADDGSLMRCTYLGGSGEEGPDGIYTNQNGEVFFTGNTSSFDFPVTGNALQNRRGKQNDAIVVFLSADFSKLKYSSYLGGDSYNDGRSCFFDSRGEFYLTGSSNGPGWPLLQPHQAQFAGGGGGKELCYQGGCYAGDVIVTKLVPVKGNQ